MTLSNSFSRRVVIFIFIFLPMKAEGDKKEMEGYVSKDISLRRRFEKIPYTKVSFFF